MNQISLRADCLDDLRTIYSAISEESGVSEVFPVTHGEMTHVHCSCTRLYLSVSSEGISISLYFEDPEGNRVEVFVDTPFYCQQPQRVPVDLGESDAQILEQVQPSCSSLVCSIPIIVTRARKSQQVEKHARSQPNFMSRVKYVEKARLQMQEHAARRGSRL